MNNMIITLADVLFESHVLDEFGCCKLIINDEVIWDDDVDWNEYIKFANAVNKYTETHPNWSSCKVFDIDIQIVHMHHSIINIHCEKVRSINYDSI